MTLRAGGAVLSGMRIKKARVKLKERRLADVTLIVSGQIVDGMDKLHNCLRRLADVEIVEEPLRIQDAA